MRKTAQFHTRIQTSPGPRSKDFPRHVDGRDPVSLQQNKPTTLQICSGGGGPRGAGPNDHPVEQRTPAVGPIPTENPSAIGEYETTPISVVNSSGNTRRDRVDRAPTNPFGEVFRPMLLAGDSRIRHTPAK